MLQRYCEISVAVSFCAIDDVGPQNLHASLVFFTSKTFNPPPHSPQGVIDASDTLVLDIEQGCPSACPDGSVAKYCVAFMQEVKHAIYNVPLCFVA